MAVESLNLTCNETPFHAMNATIFYAAGLILQIFDFISLYFYLDTEIGYGIVVNLQQVYFSTGGAKFVNILSIIIMLLAVYVHFELHHHVIIIPLKFDSILNIR